LNHRKKTKADGSRLIPRKHTETLVRPLDVSHAVIQIQSSKNQRKCSASVNTPAIVC